MADNAFVKIGTALLKHQVKKLVGEEAMGAISAEFADIGGDKLDSWLGDRSTVAEIEKAAGTARDLFRGKVNDDEVEQWMLMLPIHDLPAVLSAIEELPKSPDETKLENALRESIALNWKKLSPAQVDNAVNAFLFALRSALLPIEEQGEMVVRRAVLRIEEKTEKIDKTTERIEDKLDKALQSSQSKSAALQTGWFFAHRYGDLETFTGRTAELNMLNAWLNNDKDNLLMLRALGGFGKSALTWQWFNNKVDKTKWQTAVWWSFYEKESGFESFLAETLNHLGVEVKQSARMQLNDLLEAMRGTNILIVLDGFERLLRQYGRMDAALQSDDEDADIDPSQRDCSSPLTETFLRGLSGAGMKSKVLMTTRLCPRVLESADGVLLKGCREEPLAAFSPEDAVTYFHNEGIKATRAEIVEVCAAYGYHPLSLSLLVGLINEDHERRGDIAAVKNLEIFADVKARRHHVLERAYESLAPERRDLLSRISCFRGSMEYAVLKKVFPSPELDKALLDLRQRGLVLVTSQLVTGQLVTRFDMHPIVRHYAYDHFTDEKRRKEAHVQLAMHFIDAMPVTNKNVKTLEDLAPVIELYHHMVRAGNLDEAANIFFTKLTVLYHFFGSFQLMIELLIALINSNNDYPTLKSFWEQAEIMNMIGISYSSLGQPLLAVEFLIKSIRLSEKESFSDVLSAGLGNLAGIQILIGALAEAEHNVNTKIAMQPESNDHDFIDWSGYEYSQALGIASLGYILMYKGAWDEVEEKLKASEKIHKKNMNTQFLGVISGYRAQKFLLMARINPQSKAVNLKSAIESAQRALELADEDERTFLPVPSDYVRAYWLLGAAYRANWVSTGSTTELTLAEENLSKALNLCRRINMVDHEADILLDLARLSYAQGDFKDAQEKASEALVITERSGYVLQGADVNLFLAQYALEQEKDKVKAKSYAEAAKKLATCDGPPYYYKVAYEEAERMLERLSL